VAKYLESFGLIALLDDLRDAYELAKNTQHAELQSHLMRARRTLVELLQQNLDLHSEILDLQERLSQAQGEVARLKTGDGSMFPEPPRNESARHAS
jgi:hypothetical protein